MSELLADNGEPNGRVSTGYDNPALEMDDINPEDTQSVPSESNTLPVRDSTSTSTHDTELEADDIYHEDDDAVVNMDDENDDTEMNNTLTKLDHQLSMHDGIDKDTLFFLQQPNKRIDFILAYEDTEDDEKLEKRQTFEANLEEEGLEVELEDRSKSVDGKTYYLKIHAPWDALLDAAELMNLKKRIKMAKDMGSGGDGCCKCANAFTPSEDIVPEEDDFFTMPFQESRMDIFEIDWENTDSFFNNSERSLLVKNILDRTAYTSKDSENIRFGINRLKNDGVYLAAFPLHEGASKTKADDPTRFEGRDKDRARLYEAWARPGRFYCYQPLDLIRKYFGEKIGIYFAWLGYYTMMLIPASILGIAAFVYGIVTLWWDVPTMDICDEAKMGDSIMCPLCDQRCRYWKLSESCLYAKLTYCFDNPATVAFAAFMAIWAVLFLEFWKRQQREIEYEWDVSDFELDERMRPEFEFKVKKLKANPITQLREPYVPWYSTLARTCTAYSVVIFMICLVLAAIFGVIVYRIIVVAVMYGVPYDPVASNAKLITSITAALVNLVVILILNRIYRILAQVLTHVELHRTETEFEDSFTFKMFLFQFVNFYGSIFYIAFFKGRFSTKPGTNQYYLFGKYRQDQCDVSGCLMELCIQLFIVMVGKQVFSNFMEMGLPWLKKFCRTRSSKKQETEENLYMCWEEDNDLEPLPPLGLFDEYLEMVIQFGFVTIFVAAFPLAPFFALLNNIIEIRLDAWKFVCVWQRSPAYKAQDIGIWFGILQGLSFISVLSNAFIVSFTGDFIPKLVYKFMYNVDNGTMEGYVDNRMAVFSISDYYDDDHVHQAPDDPKMEGYTGTIDTCRYGDYRQPPEHPEKYEFTMQYWHVFTARLAFVIVFEHVCFLVQFIVGYMIPDVSGSVKRLMLYEKQLTKKMNFDATFAAQKAKKNQ